MTPRNLCLDARGSSVDGSSCLGRGPGRKKLYARARASRAHTDTAHHAHGSRTLRLSHALLSLGCDSTGLSLRCAQFDERTQGSPIRRAGYDGWLRNIAIGLGNGQPNAMVIAALQQRLDNTSTLVREHIQWALHQLQQRQNNTIPLLSVPMLKMYGGKLQHLR